MKNGKYLCTSAIQNYKPDGTYANDETANAAYEREIFINLFF